MNRLKIYVAGPYTRGDVAINVRNAVYAADYIASVTGHIPFCPHLTHFWHVLLPHEDINFWYEYDIEWLKLFDAILRLEGESVGADREVAIAQERGMQVFTSVFDIPRLPKA